MLDKRLNLCAEFVKGDRICDIGTDHAYLVAELLSQGKCSTAVAADINEGPLAAARTTLEKAGVLDKADVILSDGLKDVPESGITDIVIAGMGGETIANILDADKWVLDGSVKLILQPQSKLPLLCNFLEAHDFAVSDACLVRDAGRIYLIYTALKGASKSENEAEKYAPRALLEKHDPLLPEYLKQHISRLEREIAGKERAEHALDISADKAALEGLIKMQKGEETWQR